MIIQTAEAGMGWRLRVQSCFQHLLGAGFANAAGYTNNDARKVAAMGRGDGLQSC